MPAVFPRVRNRGVTAMWIKWRATETITEVPSQVLHPPPLSRLPSHVEKCKDSAVPGLTRPSRTLNDLLYDTDGVGVWCKPGGSVWASTSLQHLEPPRLARRTQPWEAPTTTTCRCWWRFQGWAIGMQW